MRKLTAVTTVLLAGTLLAACGSDEDDGATDDGATDGATTDEEGAGDDGSDDGELTQLTVGVIPVVDVAPLYLGVQEGIFAEHGIELTIETSGQGAAAIVPGVVSGEFDIGFGNAVALMAAHSQGFDLPFIAPGSSSTGIDGADYSAVLVPSGSDIQDLTDLDGRSVAVNTLNSFQDAGLREAVDQAGGDGASIEFAEVPYPDMEAALANGDVDAIVSLEPFLTIASAGDVRSISSFLVDISPDVPFLVAPYFTTAELLRSDPEIVAAFADAVRESAALATSDEAATRDILGTYTALDPEVTQSVILPQFLEEIDPAQVEYLIDFTVRQGLADEPLELSALLPEG